GCFCKRAFAIDGHDGVERLGGRDAIEGLADDFHGRRASGQDGGNDFAHIHRASPQTSAAVPPNARISRAAPIRIARKPQAKSSHRAAGLRARERDTSFQMAEPEFAYAKRNKIGVENKLHAAKGGYDTDDQTAIP